MSRLKNKLKAIQVNTVRAGRYSDGGGLYLVVDERRRRWVFRYTRDGKTTDLGLGSVKDVSLGKAREAADNLRKGLVVWSISSVRVKPAVKNFGEFADGHIKSMRPGWRNERHAKQWK